MEKSNTSVIAQLLNGVRKGEQKSIAKAISLVDSTRSEKYTLLQELSPNPKTQTIGITGPPGAGKSTLTSSLVEHILDSEPQSNIAIVAIDPSSPFNFGAILGDRIRMSKHFTDPRIYIRSLASKGSLGGLNPHTLEVLHVLQSADFDYVIIETVGVGQSEVEIAGLADISVLVLVPEAGDDVQIMKAGVIEIADIVVVNKADRPEADQMIAHLSHALHHKNIAIIKTVASKNEGTNTLYYEIKRLKGQQNIEKKAQLQTQYAIKTIQKRKTQNIDTQDIFQQLLQGLKDKNPINVFTLSNKYL